MPQVLPFFIPHTLGGSSEDGGAGIAVDSAGNAYIIGSTSSTNFPTVSPIQGSYAGGGGDGFYGDVFVIKIGETTTSTTTTTNTSTTTTSSTTSTTTTTNPNINSITISQETINIGKKQKSQNVVVTVLNELSNGVGNVTVGATISKSLKTKVSIKPPTAKTDSNGKATFNVIKKSKKKAKGTITFKAGSKFAKINVNINNLPGTTTTSSSTTTTTSSTTTTVPSVISINSWQETTSLPLSIREMTSFASDGYLFVVGGYNGTDPWMRDYSGYHDEIYSAKINSDGTLGTWNLVSTLPEPRAKHASITYNGYLYILGGSKGGGQYGGAETNIWKVKINTNGTLGSWVTLNPLPKGLSEHEAVVSKGYTFVLAGGDDVWQQDAVYSTPINPDGSIGTWETLTSLPVRRSSFSAVEKNGSIYFLGGAGVNPKSNAYYTKVNDNGTIEQWEILPLIPEDTAGGVAGVVADNYIITSGGSNWDWSKLLNSVYFSKINPDGSISDWGSLLSLPEPRGGHAMVIVNDYLYVLGGGDKVYFAKLMTSTTK